MEKKLMVVLDFHPYRSPPSDKAVISNIVAARSKIAPKKSIRANQLCSFDLLWIFEPMCFRGKTSIIIIRLMAPAGRLKPYTVD